MGVKNRKMYETVKYSIMMYRNFYTLKNNKIIEENNIIENL